MPYCNGCEYEFDEVEFLSECPFCGFEFEEDEFWQCQECGTLNGLEGDEFYCENCSATNEDADSSYDCGEIMTFECPHCGAPIEYGEDMCEDCGYMMDVNNYMD